MNRIWNWWFGPLSPDKFAHMVMRRLRRAGDRRPATYEPAAFRIVFTGDDAQAGHTNLKNYLVWSKGVPTHLPRTDEVFFFDPDTEEQRRAEWDRVMAVVGHLMREEDRFPARWFVDQFPSKRQFELMGAEAL